MSELIAHLPKLHEIMPKDRSHKFHYCTLQVDQHLVIKVKSKTGVSNSV